MSSVWASDLHLNDTQRDQYRWDLLPWLDELAFEKRVDFVGLAGDLTDAKDRHPASLVNRIGDFFAKSKNEWIIVAGNHDYISPDNPFFRFLDHFPNVTWVTNPWGEGIPVDSARRKTLFLPATRGWELVWGPYLNEKWEYIFCHGTFEGTTAENGFLLPGGIPRKPLLDTGAMIFSGDIHTPQVLEERLEYIGCPYRVHFGDAFSPRVIYFAREIEDIIPPMVSRHVVTIGRAEDLEKFPEVREGDQVKLRVRLRRAEFPNWRGLRSEIVAAAEALGWQVCGVELSERPSVRLKLSEPQETAPDQVRKEPEQYLRDYAAAQKWDATATEFGLTLLRGP